MINPGQSWLITYTGQTWWSYMCGMQYGPIIQGSNDGSHMQGSNDGSCIDDSHDDDIFRLVMMNHICRAVMMVIFAGQSWWSFLQGSHDESYLQVSDDGSCMQGSNDGSYIESSHDDDIFRLPFPCFQTTVHGELEYPRWRSKGKVTMNFAPEALKAKYVCISLKYLTWEQNSECYWVIWSGLLPIQISHDRMTWKIFDPLFDPSWTQKYRIALKYLYQNDIQVSASHA